MSQQATAVAKGIKSRRCGSNLPMLLKSIEVHTHLCGLTKAPNRVSDSLEDNSSSDFEKHLVNPHVFPPRSEHPFIIYDVLSISADTVATLHPLERMPKDTCASNEWIPLDYDQDDSLSKREENKAPLELFDEVRIGDDKIAGAVIDCLKSKHSHSPSTVPDVVHPIYGYSRCYDLQPQFRWEKCKVLNFDKDSGTFLIQWMCDQSMKWVKRSNLLFEDESQVDFQRRIIAARRLRDKIEEENRYHAFVESQALDDSVESGVLNADACTRINNRIGLCFEQTHFSDEILNDVKTMAEHCAKEVEIQVQFIKRVPLVDWTGRQLRNLTKSRPVPRKGCITLRSVGDNYEATKAGDVALKRKEFIQSVSFIEKNLYSASPSLITQIQTLMADGNIMALNLVPEQINASLSPLHPSECLKQLESHLGDTAETINCDWVYKVLGLIETVSSTMKSISRREDKTARESASTRGQEFMSATSDLYRFSRMVSLMMTTQLRVVFMNSIDRFDDYWTPYLTNDSSEKEGRDDPLIPLFRVEVVWENDDFAFNPSPDEVQEKLCDHLRNMVTSLSDITDVSERVKDAASGAVLSFMTAQHPAATRAADRIQSLIEQEKEPLKKILDDLSPYRHIAMASREPPMTSDDCNRIAIINQLSSIQQDVDTLEAQILSLVDLGVFRVELKSIVDYLREKASDDKKQLLQTLKDDWDASNRRIIARVQQIEGVITKMPDTIEELRHIQDAMSTFESDLNQLESEIAANDQATDTFHQNRYFIEEEISATSWEVKFWPEKLTEVATDVENALIDVKKKFAESLQQEIDVLQSDFEAIRQEIDIFIDTGDLSTCVGQRESGLELLDELDKIIAERDRIQRTAIAVDHPLKDLENVTAIRDVLTSTIDGWKHCCDVTKTITETLNAPLYSIDASSIDRELQSWKHASRSLADQLSKSIAKAFDQLHEQIAAFGEKLPLLQLLTNQNLAEHHWRAIRQEINPEGTFSLDNTFQDALDSIAPETISVVQRIADDAENAAFLCMRLDEMKDAWTTAAFSTTMQHASGLHLIDIDEVRQLISEQMSSLQETYSTSPDSLRSEIETLNECLKLYQDVTIAWNECQTLFVQAEETFQLEDLEERFPNEARKLSAVSDTYRRLVDALVSDPTVSSICSREGLLEDLKECRELVEEVFSVFEDA